MKIAFPSARDYIFGLKAFLAGMLALYIAFSMDLPRPYWALITVYIVSQPLAGMARSKGLYRVMGTLCGAGFALAAVPNLVDMPAVLTCTIAGWIACCLYASFIDGTPRAYAFILSGYTAAIVGFSAVDTPQDMFDIAVARAEEIILGILCVLLFSYLPFGQKVGPVLKERLDTWMRDARRWGAGTLDGSGGGWAAREDIQKLLADAYNIENLQAHARYDSPELRRAENAVFLLQRRMQRYFSLVISIDDLRAELGRTAPARLAALQPLAEEVSRWMRDDAGHAEGTRLRQTLRLALEAPGQDTVHQDIAYQDTACQALLRQMRLLVKAWESCLALEALIRTGGRVPAATRPVHHRDSGLALRSALACFIAIVSMACVWTLGAWPEGGTACTQAGVICCFFAAMDNPSAAAVAWLRVSVLGTIIGSVYMLLILPHADGMLDLALCLAPFLIPCAAFMAIPAQNGIFLPLLVSTMTLVTIQSRYTIDVAAFFNTALAITIGNGVALLTFRLTRGGGVAAVVARLIRAGRRDVLDAATGAARDADAFIARMSDRIGQLIGRIGADPERGTAVRRMLRQMQAGIQLLRLQRLRAALSPSASLRLQRVTESYADWLRGTDADAAPAIAPTLAAIDIAVAAVAGAGARERETRLALSQLRRDALLLAAMTRAPDALFFQDIPPSGAAA